MTKNISGFFYVQVFAKLRCGESNFISVVEYQIDCNQFVLFLAEFFWKAAHVKARKSFLQFYWNSWSAHWNNFFREFEFQNLCMWMEKNSKAVVQNCSKPQLQLKASDQLCRCQAITCKINMDLIILIFWLTQTFNHLNSGEQRRDSMKKF